MRLDCNPTASMLNIPLISMQVNQYARIYRLGEAENPSFVVGRKSEHRSDFVAFVYQVFC